LIHSSRRESRGRTARACAHGSRRARYIRTQKAAVMPAKNPMIKNAKSRHMASPAPSIELAAGKPGHIHHRPRGAMPGR